MYLFHQVIFSVIIIVIAAWCLAFSSRREFSTVDGIEVINWDKWPFIIGRQGQTEKGPDSDLPATAVRQE